MKKFEFIPPEDESTREALKEYLYGHVSGGKRERFAEVLPMRTRHVTVVLEDIYQAHNASAVVRSCDLFGVQELHVIEHRNRFALNPSVSVGASKWVTLTRWNERQENNAAQCLNGLKEKGYRIVATTPHSDDVLLENLSIDKPLALVFGNEETGLSETAIKMADEFVKIPMVGFTESFNISVSVAITLYDVMRRVWRSEIDWHLSDEEQKELELLWIQKTLPRFPQLVQTFMSEKFQP